MAVFRVIYALAALATIFAVCSQIVAVLRGKAKLTDHLFDGKTLLVFLAVGICTIWNVWDSLNNFVPDGSYNVHVAVQCSEWSTDQYLPALLFVSTDTDYDSSRPSTETTYTIAAITFSGGHEKSVDISIRPGKPLSVDIDDVVYTITLGDVTPKSLGITPRDNWDRSNTFVKICNICVPLLCAAGLAQGLILDKKKEDL